MIPVHHGRSPRPPVWLVVVTLALALAVLIGGCGQARPEPFNGYSRNPAPEVGDLTLPAVQADGSQTPFGLTAPEGELLLVYFGYTSCPDICPTTLADVRLALDDLGGDADRVRLAMASIDVETDTPEILNDYVGSFVPDAIALRTTDDAELRRVAARFGADYGVTTGDDGRDEVYHTTALYAIDDQGSLVITWPFGISADALASDIGRLLDGDRP